MNYLQLFGIVLFLLLYLFATSKYPGGTQLDAASEGYDWINNYWCNLLNKVAMNGAFNPARPYAICGMITICLSLVLFFCQFAEFIASTKSWKNAIKFGGTLSMVTTIFLFTKHHDLVTIFSSLFGVVAAIGIVVEIHKTKQNNSKGLSLMIILLVLANNGIYYSGQFIEWLPILQKVTFVMIMVWVVQWNFKIRARIKSSSLQFDDCLC